MATPAAVHVNRAALVGLAALAHQQGILLPALRIGGMMVVMLTTFLVIKQNDILYIPSPVPGQPRDELVTPDEFDEDLPYEDVNIAVDGQLAHGWLIKQSATSAAENRRAATVVYFHGNAGNISNRLPYYAELRRKVNVNVLAAEYRGYGKSEGSPSEAGMRRDAEEFVKFALNHPDIDPERVVVFGRSLGGAVGIHVAAALPKAVKAVVLENTFLSVADIAFVLYPFLRVVRPFMKPPLLTSTWLSKDTIKAVKSPILFISGEKDELIPPEHMKSLFRLCARVPGTKFCSVPEGTHNDTPVHGGDQYYEYFSTFLDEVLGGGPLPVEEQHEYHGERRNTNLSEASITDEEDFHMFS